MNHPFENTEPLRRKKIKGYRGMVIFGKKKIYTNKMFPSKAEAIKHSEMKVKELLSLPIESKIKLMKKHKSRTIVSGFREEY